MTGYNLPPGVSGLEPQIAGYPERDETRTVGNCTEVGERRIQQVGRRRFRSVLCTFEGGQVQGLLVGSWRTGGTFYWTCPECGTENDTEAQPDDPGDDDLMGYWR